MLKKCKLVMLPTKEKSTIYRNWHSHASTLHLGDFAYCDKGDNKRMNQHLYITSDEEIKEGDWCYSTFNNHQPKIQQRKGDWKTSFNQHKIIATTDKSLIIGWEEDTHPTQDNGKPIYLPEPSQSFIEKYIEEYNKGNVITDVLVEYDCDHNQMPAKVIDILKINPKDNTITIKQVKDSWNREEVEHLCKVVYRYGAQNHGDATLERFDKWIEENL